MQIKLPCYRCGHYECYGFDWCLCDPCDMKKEYSALLDKYIDLTRQERWDEALEVLSEMHKLCESKERVLKGVTI